MHKLHYMHSHVQRYTSVCLLSCPVHFVASCVRPPYVHLALLLRMICTTCCKVFGLFQRLQSCNARTSLLLSAPPCLRVLHWVRMQIEPVEERLMATSCSDNSVSVWDVRKLSQGGKPISSISHSLTCQSAFFAPDGGFLTPLTKSHAGVSSIAVPSHMHAGTALAGIHPAPLIPGKGLIHRKTAAAGAFHAATELAVSA